MGTQMVSFNKPNKHKLIFNLNIRVIIHHLKLVHIRFHKPNGLWRDDGTTPGALPGFGDPSSLRGSRRTSGRNK